MRLHAFGVASRFQRATTNIRNLKTQDYLRTPIPVPSIDRQRRVAERADEFFALADRIETVVRSTKLRLKRLRSAVLHAAFRGELVPQDPNDEPASVLLERIAAERAAAPKPTRKRREKAPA